VRGTQIKARRKDSRIRRGTAITRQKSEKGSRNTFKRKLSPNQKDTVVARGECGRGALKTCLGKKLSLRGKKKNYAICSERTVPDSTLLGLPDLGNANNYGVGKGRKWVLFCHLRVKRPTQKDGTKKFFWANPERATCKFSNQPSCSGRKDKEKG